MRGKDSGRREKAVQKPAFRELCAGQAVPKRCEGRAVTAERTENDVPKKYVGKAGPKWKPKLWRQPCFGSAGRETGGKCGGKAALHPPGLHR